MGGTSVREDTRILQGGVHCVVGTPGRVYDMLRRRALRADNIRMFVLDEADEMLSRGFKDQIYDIFQLLPPKLQVHPLVLSLSVSVCLFDEPDEVLSCAFLRPSSSCCRPSFRHTLLAICLSVCLSAVFEIAGSYEKAHVCLSICLSVRLSEAIGKHSFCLLLACLSICSLSVRSPVATGRSCLPTHNISVFLSAVCKKPCKAPPPVLPSFSFARVLFSP